MFRLYSMGSPGLEIVEALMSTQSLQAFYASPAELRSARLRDLHALWQEGCGGAAFPGLPAIDPIVLKRFLTDLIIVDVSDPDQPRYRLVGSGFRDFFAQNFAGTLVREAAFPEREQVAEYHRRVALSGRPLLGWYRWQSDENVTYYSEFVVLPYGEGVRVERLLVMEDLDLARRGAAIAPGGMNG
jgi:hypothetical protein